MTAKQTRRRTTTVVATVALLLAANSSGFSQTSGVAKAQLAVRDIALQSGGVLNGRITDREGRPLPGYIVSLWYGDREVARTRSNTGGKFTFRGLRGGVHQIMTRDDLASCRLWTADTAPPAARKSLLLYNGSIVRGQCACGGDQCSACTMVSQELPHGDISSPSDLSAPNSQPLGAPNAAGNGDTVSAGYQEGGSTSGCQAGCGGGCGDACASGWYGGGGRGRLLMNRRLLVAGGLIGAAIAIPVALADDAGNGS
jgi:hypothetical protein